MIQSNYSTTCLPLPILLPQILLVKRGVGSSVEGIEGHIKTKIMQKGVNTVVT